MIIPPDVETKLEISADGLRMRVRAVNSRTTWEYQLVRRWDVTSCQDRPVRVPCLYSGPEMICVSQIPNSGTVPLYA